MNAIQTQIHNKTGSASSERPRRRILEPDTGHERERSGIREDKVARFFQESGARDIDRMEKDLVDKNGWDYIQQQIAVSLCNL